MLYVGGGAQGSAAEVRALAERAEVPVVTSLMGKGAFPESHRLFVGWPGMHGCRAANLALHHADVIVAAGVRFDDRVTGRVDTFAPNAQVVHIDIDGYEHGKVRSAEVPILGELADVLPEITGRQPGVAPDRRKWHRTIADWGLRHPLRTDNGRSALSAPAVIGRLNQLAAGRDVIWTTGVGQHQMWAMQHLRVESPGRSSHPVATARWVSGSQRR